MRGTLIALLGAAGWMVVACVGAQAPDAGTAPVACLPDDSGFLQARLGGVIEADVDWRDPGLDCEGMLRPDGQGLRVRFAGSLPDGRRLALLFASRSLEVGKGGRGLPVNVTVMDESAGLIYGTLGEGRCTLDEVEQTRLADPDPTQNGWALRARGFCTEPARALDGSGNLVLTRFDFAGRVTVPQGDDPGYVGLPAEGVEPLEHFPQSVLSIERGDARQRFRVWVADTPARHSQGLMFVRQLDPDRGMLFLFDPPRHASFWMYNTYIPLDLLFIAPDGRIVNIIEHAEPHSLRPLMSAAAVRGVLEVAGGTAERLGLKSGDRVNHPAFAAR
jgi:uncharacterized membrane protein (UPF0127 family)